MEKKFQIFISSTYEDLRSERKEIMEATLVMGHIPAGMELFSAADDEQWKIITDRIDECDYYVVIVAHRYGSVTDEGISFTEKEYRYAQQRGVPTLRFLIDDQISWPPSNMESDPAKKASLERFRQELLTKPVDFWKSASDLGGKYSRAFPKLIRSHPRSGWVSGASVVGPEVLSELSRLSHENAELRKEIEEIKKKSSLEIQELLTSLGQQKFKMLVRLAKGTERDVWKPTNLLKVFNGISLSLVAESDTERLSKLAGLQLGYKPAELKQSWPVPMNHVEYILARLFGYGLVEPSTKRHSVSDTKNYWSLTDKGRELLKYKEMEGLLVKNSNTDQQSGNGSESMIQDA